MKVMIDPGYGGSDSGAIRKGILEKDLNLSISKKLRILLNGHDIISKLTRRKDEFIDLETRAFECNEYEYDLFISIHCNIYCDPKVKGVEIIHYPKSINGYNLAKSIMKEVTIITGEHHRSVREDDRGLYLLKATKCPAIIVECGYMSNTEDLSKLTSETYQWIIAIGIYRGIVEHIEK